MKDTNLGKRYFKKIIKAAGLSEDFTIYHLRHTMATLLLLENVNPKIVSERLGHSSVGITLDTYSHVLPHMQEGATDKLTAILYSPENSKDGFERNSNRLSLSILDFFILTMIRTAVRFRVTV